MVSIAHRQGVAAFHTRHVALARPDAEHAPETAPLAATA
jgi:hypothetical protein